MSQKKGKFFNGVILGGLLGAASYYLFGTKEGKKTQKKIRDEGERIYKKAEKSTKDIEKKAKEITAKAKDSTQKIETKAQKLISKAKEIKNSKTTKK